MTAKPPPISNPSGRLAPLILAAVLASPSLARADLANNEAIHEHVDAVVAGVDVTALDPARTRALLADRLTLSLGALVPIYGSYKLDHKVFGDVRPAAVVFDWILGGFVPVGLGVTALAGGNALSSETRSILAWTAVGLYASTRIGVFVIGNLHISEYNRVLRLRLGLGAAATADHSPTLTISAAW
ncbi:MAG: hypothetical protein ABJE66_04350 [Deltaproteobacteria bacterium]